VVAGLHRDLHDGSCDQAIAGAEAFPTDASSGAAAQIDDLERRAVSRDRRPRTSSILVWEHIASDLQRGEWIFVTLTDILTKGERKLAASRRGHFVRSARREFQDVMRGEFTIEIEALTGRRVIAFLSDNHMDPDVAIECFQLAPATPDA
jgi:uncharacterized protein YbcI